MNPKDKRIREANRYETKMLDYKNLDPALRTRQDFKEGYKPKRSSRKIGKNW